jgi:hypothetical protein
MSSMVGYQEDLFNQSGTIDFLEEIVAKSEQLYLKKLSRNDRSWARPDGPHQAGVYISPEERDSGFFPALKEKERAPGEPLIWEVFFNTIWPAVGEHKLSRLVNYTSKGTETHFTRLPKAAFEILNPASFLLIGKTESTFTCITVDSQDSGYQFILDRLSLRPDFITGIFDIQEVSHRYESQLSSFVDEILQALSVRKIGAFAREYATMPSSSEIADKARKRFLEKYNYKSLSPFELEKPGDAIREISRGIEYDIFKEHQLRAKAIELVGVIVGDNLNTSLDQIVRNIAFRYPDIDAVLLSASQQRKSRAGLSFEHHISAMLTDGGIPFEEQVVLQSKRRPDFVLPSLALYNEEGRSAREAIVLSAKTTLRERWKQVLMEIRNCQLFLATLDENISASAIQDMGAKDIVLVVPESLKDSDTTEYKDQGTVISFKKFFTESIRAERWPMWLQRGVVEPIAIKNS